MKCNSTVAVTGCCGFIGSHLTKRLLEEGYYVIGIDNLFTGRIENIINIKNDPHFEFIRHDVVFPLFLECDEIYHLASPASPIYYQKNPIKTVKTNLLGTMNMLGIAKRVHAKMLFSSTSEVYGDPMEHPQKEEYWGNVNPIGARACYDEGKRVAETIMTEYRKMHNVDSKIVRIFNTYGPNMAMNDGRVISNFIVQALKDEDITIYGTGEQTRSFCYADDMIKGLTAMMNQPYEVSGPVNLGSDEEVTVRDLAQMVIKMTKSESNIVFRELPENDPSRRKPDLSKAQKLLDFRTEMSLEDGLERTINYFRSIIC